MASLWLGDKKENYNQDKQRKHQFQESVQKINSVFLKAWANILNYELFEFGVVLDKLFRNLEAF